MTENCGTCTHTIQDDPTSGGTIGPPQPVNELKLVDVPEMNYTAEDKPNARGELCVRGMNCFIGYYKGTYLNACATTQLTWHQTRKILRILSRMDGYTRVMLQRLTAKAASGSLTESRCVSPPRTCFMIHRRVVVSLQNIMKLAQGEYVALEKVENSYTACPIVQQIYVHGDSLQPYLLAVVIPDPVVLAPLVSALFGRKISADDTEALREAVKDPRVIQEVLELLTKEAKKRQLSG